MTETETATQDQAQALRPQLRPQLRHPARRQHRDMADAEADRADRPGRRRPFSSFMKRLATNLKGSGDGGRHVNSKRATRTSAKKPQSQSKDNNPCAESGRVDVVSPSRDSHRSVSTAHGPTPTPMPTPTPAPISIPTEDQEVVWASGEQANPPMTGGLSIAPTCSTDQETSLSVAPSHRASSVAGTSRTANGGLDSRKGDSTFSSPAPSVRSLTTTLTTIQSMAPNGAHLGLGHAAAHHQHSNHSNHSGSQLMHFNQPFPTSSPASALPPHLAPSANPTGHPTTYHTATANNLLTDNASILTLASSTKRRRRRSFDTDASVRALAPSSIFGGSRESLPLSVLSSNIDGTQGPATPGIHRGAPGMANERTSMYSATGMLGGDRNSFYAKQAINASAGGTVTGDGASVRSGLPGHGRTESVNGSIGGIGAMGTTSLASPLVDRPGIEEK